ncbi:DUF5957 family protein [Nocardiopsis sp. NPDC050513]|uniref:DUF5957 family protein n=1 Tax=Nocardiopsis sp. NPDC050513 TaxID=3364338 RepID=UPI00379C89D4
MRVLLMGVVGLVAGFLAGLVVDQIVGIISVLAFDQPVGIRGLPIILALVFCAGGLILGSRSRSG